MRTRTVLLLCGAAWLVLAAAGCERLSRQPSDDIIQPAEPRKKQEKTIKGVGSAPTGQGEEKAADRALTKARRNMASNIQTYVVGLLKDYVARSDAASGYGGDWKELGNLLASETAALQLQELGEYSSWKNPAGNTLFVQYEVPKQAVRATAARNVPRMLQTVNPFGDGKQAGVKRLTRFLKEGPRQTRPAPTPGKQAQKQQKEEKEKTGPDVPAWLTKGPGTVHPPEKYVAEVGVGNDRAQAERAARRQVAERLSVRMRSTASRLSRSAERRELAEQIEQLPRAEMAYKPDVLGTPGITHTWYDSASATYYALAALERSAAGKKALDAALSASRDGRTPLKKARRTRDAGQPGKAMKHYAAALGHMQDAARSALAAVLLGDEAESAKKLKELTGKLALKESHRELADLVGNMRLDTVSGNLQWVAPGTRPEALGVMVTAAGQPASRIPVRFRPADGEDAWSEVVATESDGSAHCRPPRLEGHAGLERPITAELAPSELSEHISRLRLEVPQVRFRCVLRGRKATRFAVRIYEQSVTGGRAAASVVEPRLKEELTSGKYRLQELSGVKQGGLWTDAGELRTEELVSACRATTPVADLAAPPVAVAGTCTPEVRESTPTSQGTLYIVAATIRLRVIDPAFSGSSGATVISVSATEQGAYTDDRAEAYRQARQAAVQKCASRLLEELRARLQ